MDAKLDYTNSESHIQAVLHKQRENSGLYSSKHTSHTMQDFNSYNSCLLLLSQNFSMMKHLKISMNLPKPVLTKLYIYKKN